MVKNYRNVKFTSTLKVFIFTLFYREEIEGPKGLSLGYLLLNHKAEPEFKAPSNPVQHPCLEDPTARGTWWAVVHGVAKGSGMI